MMTQTLAIFVDAYRDLNARKMFWTVLALNVFAMMLFAVLGTDGHVLTVLWYKPFGDFLTDVSYKEIYGNVVVGFWFTWIAAILALISTGGIIPDLMSSGSIDLYLAKPLGRLRLFLTKYVAGLLFVILQVALFAAMSFLVLGVRAHLWEPGLFVSIPLVVLFFSYLFGICVLIGTLTRSTIAAILLTILVWTGIAVVDYLDERVGQAIFLLNAVQDSIPQRIEAIDSRIAALNDSSDPAAQEQLKTLQSQRASLVESRDRGIVPSAATTIQNVLFDIKTFLPKTRETVSLMDRFLFQDEDLQQAVRISDDSPDVPTSSPMGRGRGFGRGTNISGTLIQAQLDRQRSIWWIIGTSLIFEAICVALAAWHFCTRDF